MFPGSSSKATNATHTSAQDIVVGKVQLTLKVNVHQSAYDQPSHEITNTVNVEIESELTSDSLVIENATVKIKPAGPALVVHSAQTLFANSALCDLRPLSWAR